MLVVKKPQLSLIVLALLLVSQSGTTAEVSDNTQASSPDAVERLDEELLVLEMRLGQYVLSEGLIGYARHRGVLLSFEDAVNALEFAISVDPASGTAAGWFLNEDRSFSLDVESGKVTIEGLVYSIDSALVQLHSDGIYVDAALLSQWFPVELKIDLPRLIVEVTSQDPLPLEQRLERESARSRLIRNGAISPGYPKVYASYSLLDWPFIDANTNFVNRSPETGGREARYSGSVSGDLLFMNSVLYVAGIDEDSLTDVRLTLGRSDPEENLLGPLQATSLSLGDIFSPQIPLISNSRVGVGGKISNFPLSRPSEFDRTTLQGELPQGWEVELYRNDVLLDFQESRADGRYEFNDVPLLYGVNVLRIAFYGPQGQKREEIQRFHVGSGLVRPGKHYYRFAASRQDQFLFRTEQLVWDREAIGEGRYIGELERGLSHRVSIAVGGVSLPFADKRRQYANVGLRASLLRTFSRIDVAKEIEGGTAVQVATQFTILGNTVVAEHGQFFGFTSERARGEGDPYESLTNIRLDGTLSLWPRLRIPFSLNGMLERRESGLVKADLLNRLSLYFGGVSLSHIIRGSAIDGGALPFVRRVDAFLLLSGRLKRMAVRAQLNYDPPPNHKFKVVAFTSDYSIPRDFTARFTAERDLLKGLWTSYSLGLNRTFEVFLVGVEGRYRNKTDYSISLLISFGLGWKPRSNGLRLRSRRMGTDGAASLRVFLDNNLNGVFDKDDQALEGVRVRFGSNTSRATDKQGVSHIPHLASYRPTDITIDIGSLEDPFWIPANEGVTVIPRPGKSISLDIPVIVTGEIDGIVFIKRDSSMKGAANVGLELLDGTGKVVQSVKTAFDGFYLFSNVPPGVYTVRVSPDQLKRLNLEPQDEREVAIEGNGAVVSRIDFTVSRVRSGED